MICFKCDSTCHDKLKNISFQLRWLPFDIPAKKDKKQDFVEVVTNTEFTLYLI